MTPTEIIKQAFARMKTPQTSESIESSLSVGIGAIGALLDIGVISGSEWHDAIEELYALAEQFELEVE